MLFVNMIGRLSEVGLPKGCGRQILLQALAVMVLADVSSGGAASGEPSGVKIEVRGEIAPRCSNSGASFTFDLKDMSKAGSSGFSFQIDCNAPFIYALESENGAFVAEGGAQMSPAGFTSTVPYTVYTRLPLTGGRTIDDSCASASLKKGAQPCPFSTSGDAISIRQIGEVKVSWPQTRLRLLPGAYSDRLTIDISIRR